MTTGKEQWRLIIRRALNELAEKFENPITISSEEIVTEVPPKPELGDIAFPMFPFAKYFKTSPKSIAERMQETIESDPHAASLGTVTTAGPYLNVSLCRPLTIAETVARISEEGLEYGKSNLYKDQKIMIEFSAPNTNKPLHLGHLRNDALGESIGRILSACGAVVKKVNLINDRGIHICKSMIAYRKFGNRSTPESEGVKGDHFVGKFYVKFNKWAKEDETAEQQAREMLQRWEAGDPEVTELWKTMNRWTIEGIEETYKKTGVSFDAVYLESEVYQRGREEVLKGLEREVFFKDERGTVWADLSTIGLDKKVLLRGDGTTLYLTQDLGTAIARYEDWNFDKQIYVVGSEQKYHFQVLFYLLKQLGYDWADNLFHLSYGMVNLPEGKMKSREGTVVDADDLLEELVEYARMEIIEKEREHEVEDIDATSEKIALAALNYYLLQINPAKDIIFDPKETIVFNGNTGPYLQYTGARISAMLRKYEQRKKEFAEGNFQPELLTVEDEWGLIKLIGSFTESVEQAANDRNPAAVASSLYELAKTFSRYYHENPVLHNADPHLVVTRITLVKTLLQVMKNGFKLIGIPFLEKM